MFALAIPGPTVLWEKHAVMLKALGARHPRWIPGYPIKVLDGNHLSATEHRLKELRGTWAAPLPGQALVLLDQQHVRITDIILSEDGHAQERSSIPEVLQRVEADQLWIEDRNFCTLDSVFGMARRGRRSWYVSTANFKVRCGVMTMVKGLGLKVDTCCPKVLWYAIGFPRRLVNEQVLLLARQQALGQQASEGTKVFSVENKLDAVVSYDLVQGIPLVK